MAIGTLAAFLLVLEAVSKAGLINPFIMPPPSDVARAFGGPELAGLMSNFLLTLAMTITALCIATVMGVFAGWLFYRYDLLRNVGEAMVAAMASAPMILLYPLFLVLFGRGLFTVIIMAAVTATPPIVLKTADGLLSTRKTLLNVGRSLRLSPRQLFFKIELPAAAPTIFNGIRLGLMIALIGIVAVEFLINIGGLGRMISDLADLYEIPAMYGVMIFVVAISMIVYYVTEKAERWLRPV